MQNLSYLKKQDSPMFQDLLWNIPEQKSGKITLVGGNSQNFSNLIKTAEYITTTFPVKETSIVFPDVLKKSLPPLPNLIFTESTESGSFKKSSELNLAVQNSDFTIFLGDLSKNAATAIAISESIKNSQNTPIMLTKDTIDLCLNEFSDFIEKDNLFILGSLAQIQKLFRALYFPKMIMLSQPIVPILEALHKFTLSYKTTIITFHQNQIIVANSGKITTTPIENTPYSPITLWSGQLASKIAELNLYNPGIPLEATTAAIL